MTEEGYAKANAEYLGYRGNDVERQIDLTFTPGANNLKDTLKPSIKKIVGWENSDNQTLVELIKQTLISVEIIKASLFHPYKPGDQVTGDIIQEKQSEKQQQDDTEWEEFKTRVNNPGGLYNVPKPKAQIKDFTTEDTNS